MANLTPARLSRLTAGFPGRIAIETGTFQADTTRRLLAHFPIVHTIELDPDRWARCTAILQGTAAVCHQGDSAVVLPELLARYPDEPIFFYLDAHHIARRDLGSKAWPLPVADSFPLWSELTAISRRNQPDRVIVDDVHAFGRQEKGWSDVAIPRLRQTLRRVRYARVLADQWIAQLDPV